MSANVKQMIKKYDYLVIIGTGILLRLLWLMIMPTYPETDFMWYHMKATELAEGKGLLNSIYPYYIGRPGYPSAFRPIGYPGTLALLYFIFGSSFMVGKLFNVFLTAIIMFCSYQLANKFFGKKIALISLLVFALSPLAITYTSIHCSEILFSAILVLAVYVFFNKNNPVIMGLLAGYLTLVRPIGMMLPAVFVLYMFLKDGFHIKQKLKYISIFAVMVGIVVAPWIIRNYMAFGKPVYSTNGGYVFYVNNNDYATGSWSDPFKYPNSPLLKYKTEDGFDEMGIHVEGKKLAMEWIKKHPIRFLELGCLRIANSYWLKTDDIMWSLTIGLNKWHPIKNEAIMMEKIIYKPFYIMVFAFMIYTLITFIKTRKADFGTFLLLLFLYFNGMMFVLEGNPRYVFPLHPLYSICAGYVIFRLLIPFLPKKYLQGHQRLK